MSEVRYLWNCLIAEQSLAQTSPFLILISSKKKQSNKTDFECIHPYEQLIERCWIKKASSITDRVGDIDDIVSKCHPKHAESDNDKDEYQVCKQLRSI